MEYIIKRLNRCRICPSKEYKVLFLKENYEIAKCKKCGFVFLNFAPNKEFFINYYSDDFFNDSGKKHGFRNYEKEEVNLKKTFTDRVNILKKYQDSGSLLDLGCATGIFMEVAKYYWDVHGVEISSYAASIAQKKGLDVFAGELEKSPYINSKFDVITLWDTIEHISNPVETIKIIGSMVKKGGIISFTTGDVGSFVSKLSGNHWHLYNIPQHLSYFDKKSVTRILDAGGFKVKKIFYHGVHFTLDYLLFRLITFYKKFNFAMPLYKKISQSKILDIGFKINLFDIMLVIAEKR